MSNLSPLAKDLVRATAKAIIESVRAAGPDGCPESIIHLALQGHGLSYQACCNLITTLVNIGSITREGHLLRVPGAL